MATVLNFLLYVLFFVHVVSKKEGRGEVEAFFRNFHVYSFGQDYMP